MPVNLAKGKTTENTIEISWNAPAKEEGTIDFFILHAKGGGQELTRTIPIQPTPPTTTTVAPTTITTGKSNAEQGAFLEEAADQTQGVQPDSPWKYTFDNLFPSTTYEIDVYTKNKQAGAPEDELVGPPASISITTVSRSKAFDYYLYVCAVRSSCIYLRLRKGFSTSLFRV